MEEIKTYPTLYKRDTNGNVRQWNVESCAHIPGTRTVCGNVNGKLITSEWKKTSPKNTGKKNATTAIQQADEEAKAKWDKQVEKDYFVHRAAIDSYSKFKPQLAHDYTKRPQASGYSQPKLDGIRCIARRDGLYTRSGKRITSCQHVRDALKTFFLRNPETILDGELYNHELNNDFNQITSLVRKTKASKEDAARCAEMVQYHVYDMCDRGKGAVTFVTRIDYVCYQLNDHRGPIRTVPATWCGSQEELDREYALYTEQGYEGQMVRNDAAYENKRSMNLLKRKEFITEEFDVVKVLEGRGNWSGHAKHFTLDLGDGRTFNSGVRGNKAILKDLLEQEVPPTWVTCRYFERTPDGVPRFPVVIDWGHNERID
tara:strand:- start:16309 stop:17424 length:1116 start_codon:yes stop_codon:yes gene_type:complete